MRETAANELGNSTVWIDSPLGVMGHAIGPSRR